MMSYEVLPKILKICYYFWLGMLNGVRAIKAILKDIMDTGYSSQAVQGKPITSKIGKKSPYNCTRTLESVTKLTRGIKVANHHSELLQTAVDSRKPPIGLIPN